MKECLDLRPVLSRVAEGEACPEEALAAARHLEDCTACRIVLAKERRLARMLEHELDDGVIVGEEFLQRVMERLPEGPPPPRRRRNRRGLTVAALTGLSALTAAAASAWSTAPAGSGGSLIATPIPLGAETWGSQLENAASAASALASALGAARGIDLTSLLDVGRALVGVGAWLQPAAWSLALAALATLAVGRAIHTRSRR